MTDEEKTEKYLRKNKISNNENWEVGGEYCYTLCKQAHLDGLAEGRKEKWHDLRKNLNDLPETSIYLSNYSDVVLRQDGTPVRYDFKAGEWIFELHSFYERCEVIAWTELPKFEEE